jgi:DNA polymerase V
MSPPGRLAERRPRTVAVADCNNFFVSCERLLRPDLENKPVVVLSSNDGVVISRSAEAKALGMAMGEPFFKVEGFCKAHGVTVFSSNFGFYERVSRKVMAVLGEYTDSLEVYSVDEAFFSLDIATVNDDAWYARRIRRAVKEKTGIPVSVGLGPTKTLAKLMLEAAKKSTAGVSAWADVKKAAAYLETVPVKDVWGIGRRTAAFLERRGIATAEKFRNLPDDWIRRNLTIRGLHTAWELRGHPCIRLREVEGPQKSIQVSRSFGRDIQSFGELRDAVTRFVVTGARRLRDQRSLASRIEVCLATSHFRPGFFIAGATRKFLPTDYTPFLIGKALDALEEAFRPGPCYTKAGIHLYEFVPEETVQRGLFRSIEEDLRPRERILMKTVDRINVELRREAIAPASVLGAEKAAWRPKQEKLSAPVGP